MKNIFLFIFFVLFSFPLFAQENWTIQSIQFEGLEKTKPHYLLQFLKSKEGEIFQTKNLENDIQQLWNVGTNQSVNAKVDSLPGQEVILTFQLKEKKTLLPIINFGGVEENIWYQLGFIDFNFSGRGHQFLAFYQNTDNRHGGQLYYRMPYINKKWGLAWNLLQFRSQEPLFFQEGTVFYNYDNLLGEITFIRNFGFRKRVELSTGLFQEKYQKNGNQILADPPGPSELTVLKTTTKLEYIDNRLDFYDFYIHGWSWRGISQTVFNLEDDSHFLSLILQARRFHRVGEKGNLAARFRFGLSSNNDSPFAPFVVDSRVNLRGSGNRIERGTGQIILNLEYRHTLLNLNNWAIQGVVFSDLGNWRTPGGSLSEFFDKDELRQFVGGGFRLIFKPVFGAILRVDYGIDIYETSRRGIVLGVGQYF